MTEYIDLSEFKKNNSFYDELNLLISIKSFDLQAIRNRYLTTKDKKSKRTGSFVRREVTEGGVAGIQIKNGKIVNQEIFLKVPEPRGIDIKNNVLAVSSENRVYVIHENGTEVIQDPWFSFIHTIDIRGSKVLISSSGYDVIFEYDFLTNKKTFEWFAWENGFNHGLDPETGEKLYLTRNIEESAQYKAEGKKHILITDPKNQTLPTSQRAAFINSVVYDPNDKNKVIATFFHEGSVFSIDIKSGKSTKLLDGLKSPHGGKRRNNEYVATSTTGGSFVTGNLNNNKHYKFQNIEGKSELLLDFEWIQNSVISGSLVVSIDSNRNCFVIFDTEKKLIDLVPFDDNFAIQDLVFGSLSSNQKENLKNIKE
ncbi:MAG: hypothetical protein KAR57_03125 [Bacteroidales bacterium]|nr:hypothetical protein [Bacteroidales bacterium]